MQNLIQTLSLRPLVFSKFCRHISRGVQETYYDILCVKSNCSDKEIRQAFVKLSKKFHPDASGSKSDPYLTSRFVKISEAYRTLSKPKLRTAYDQNLWEKGIRVPREEVSDRTEFHRPWEIVPNRDPNPGPYYGIDGINRISNSQLAVALILLGVVGAILGFASVKYSVTLNTQQLDEKSAKAGAIHASVRADAQKFGNEEQMRRILNKLLKEDR